MAEEQKSITGLEALALGAYELVSKVSLVLAVPGGIRTEEHVRWSFALIKRDIEEKTRLVVSNGHQKKYGDESLRAKVINMLSNEQKESGGVIVNRCRPVASKIVQSCLTKMVAEELLFETTKINPTNGKLVTEYARRALN